MTDKKIVRKLWSMARRRRDGTHTTGEGRTDRHGGYGEQLRRRNEIEEPEEMSLESRQNVEAVPVSTSHKNPDSLLFDERLFLTDFVV